MTSLYTQQDKNVYKTWALFAGFLIVVIGVGWAFSYILDNQVILYVAVIFSLVMNFISYWFSDRIILRISGARPATKEEFWDLYTLTENLAIAAGLPMPGLYVIEDSAPNAFATGRNPENAVVAVTTGLLRRLERSELEGVVAHELAHVGNRDILISTIAVTLVGFVAILSDLFFRFMLFGGLQGGGDRGGGWVKIVLFAVGIALMILAPIVASVIHMAISRRREFQADATAALLTRYPAGLIGALEKISQNREPVEKASNATAHLYIVNPFGAKKEKGFHRFFMTHPPVEERIKALRGQK